VKLVKPAAVPADAYFLISDPQCRPLLTSVQLNMPILQQRTNDYASSIRFYHRPAPPRRMCLRLVLPLIQQRRRRHTPLHHSRSRRNSRSTTGRQEVLFTDRWRGHRWRWFSSNHRRSGRERFLWNRGRMAAGGEEVGGFKWVGDAGVARCRYWRVGFEGSIYAVSRVRQIRFSRATACSLEVTRSIPPSLLIVRRWRKIDRGDSIRQPRELVVELLLRGMSDDFGKNLLAKGGAFDLVNGANTSAKDGVDWGNGGSVKLQDVIVKMEGTDQADGPKPSALLVDIGSRQAGEEDGISNQLQRNVEEKKRTSRPVYRIRSVQAGIRCFSDVS
jgi:hypothetical protein